MADTKQFSRLTKITKGNTPSTDLKMTDIFAMQHIDLPSGANAYKQVSLAQSLCEPIAVTPNSTPSDGAYTATCSNYPDFSLTYTDANGNSHYLIGLKVRVVFTKGITYGSVSGGTYPTLNINGSGAIPLLAQGMTMAKGAAQNGQTIEFTIIPYGNGVAFDADSNVRESTSDYTIYTDGKKEINTYSVLFYSTYTNQCWGYYKVCNGRVFVHLKFVITAKTPDWAGLAPVGALPASNNYFIVYAKGKTGNNNSIYIFPTGSISENGGGGMEAGEYEFDFDYLKA